MNSPSPRRQVTDAAMALVGSARFSQALTIAGVGTAYLSFALRSTMGWAGLLGVLGALVVLAALSITVKRKELEWRGLLPISLLIFLGWTGLSLFWSDYPAASLGSIAYQWSFAFLGVYIGLTRDLIQIVRALGDVFRAVLVVSFVLELLSGLLLDVPFTFLKILGNMGEGGPIQGLLGSRNQMGLVALIALVTFFVELLTRSTPKPLAIFSIVLAGLMILLTRSPVIFGVFGAVTVATVALIALRRVEPSARRVSQFVLLGLAVVTITITFFARGRVIELLNAGSEFEARYSLWRRVLDLTPSNTLEGFGWIGYWRRGLQPFFGIDRFAASHDSALNAFLDVWLQLGLVGLFSFIALVGLALVRSWLLASNKRSVVFLWPALVLVVLLLTSAAESSVLVEFGWLTLVICTVKASQGLSWRSRLPEE